MLAEHPAHYVDPVLVDLYDVEASSFDYHAEFRTLAGTSPLRIVDVGCGTGLLALALAAGGHAVTGIDPAPGMIAAARAKPNPGGAVFIEADGRNFAVDAALRSRADVGQRFPGAGRRWRPASGNAAGGGASRSGGRFVFDTRNPAAREWLDGPKSNRASRSTHPALGNVDVWWEAELGGDGVTVSLVTHYRFADGSRKRSDSLLALHHARRNRRDAGAAGAAGRDDPCRRHRPPLHRQRTRFHRRRPQVVKEQGTQCSSCQTASLAVASIPRKMNIVSPMSSKPSPSIPAKAGIRERCHRVLPSFQAHESRPSPGWRASGLPFVKQLLSGNPCTPPIPSSSSPPHPAPVMG